jgi:hypothetical protein
MGTNLLPSDRIDTCAVPQETRELVERLYSDWNVGGPQAMVEKYWHRDIVWHDSPSFPDAGVHHGAEAQRGI